MLLAAAVGVAGRAASAPERSIVVVGDSLSAAYGLRAERGWVALLEQRLKKDRLDYSVVNASISGETSAGGAARLERLLARHRPRVVIIELGANDGLRGLPVEAMKQNLAAMVAQSQAAGARVLLLGVRLPPNYGPDYTRAFEAAFGEVARRRKAALVPSFLDGLGDTLDYYQPDRIHPTEAAQPILLDAVWKGLRPLLAAR